MGANARRKVLSGAIAINPARLATIKGREIVLVDDVLTSGATSEACVDALIRAGAASVKVACFARVLESEFAPTRKERAQNITPEVA